MNSTRRLIFLTAILAVFVLNGCKNQKDKHQQKDNSSSALFARGDKTPATNFSGNAYLKPLVARDKNNDLVMGSVYFEPGARTNWHKHPKGQVLIVTEGSGFYQQRGKPARALSKGDVVNIQEDVEHWHGATATTDFAHIALTNFKNDSNVIWLEPVSQVDYTAVNKK